MTDEIAQPDDGVRREDGAVPPEDAAARPSRSRLVVLAAAGVLLMPVVGLLADRTAWVSQPAAAVLHCLALTVLVAGGVLALRRLHPSGDGRLMLLIVVAIATTTIARTLGAIGPAAFVFDLLRWSVPALIALLLLRWPLGRLQTRTQVVVVVLAGVLPLVLVLIGDLLFDPVAVGWVLTDPRSGLGSTPDWWPTIAGDGAAATALLDAAALVSAAALVAVLVLVGRRLAAAGPALRRQLVPVAVAAALLAVPHTMALGAQLRLWDDPSSPVLTDVALTALPVLLLASAVLRAAEARAAEARGPAEAVA